MEAPFGDTPIATNSAALALRASCMWPPHPSMEESVVSVSSGWRGWKGNPITRLDLSAHQRRQGTRDRDIMTEKSRPCLADQLFIRKNWTGLMLRRAHCTVGMVAAITPSSCSQSLAENDRPTCMKVVTHLIKATCSLIKRSLR